MKLKAGRGALKKKKRLINCRRWCLPQQLGWANADYIPFAVLKGLSGLLDVFPRPPNSESMLCAAESTSFPP